MSSRTRLLIISANATAGVVNVVCAAKGWLPPFVTLPAAVAVGSFGGYSIVKATKELRHGRDRRAEADPQDPGSDYVTITFPQTTAFSIPHTPGSATGASPNVAEPTPELETIETDMPILAHRSARLRLDGTSRPFVPVATDSDPFGIDSHARCMYLSGRYFSISFSREHHDAPSLKCSCGFYALPTDIAPTYESPSFVTLMVELSGTVIEHEKGYRAAHQRVVECQLSPCPYCGAEVEVIDIEDFEMRQAVCAEHRSRSVPGHVYVSVDDLSRVLPVPVTRMRRRSEEITS